MPRKSKYDLSTFAPLKVPKVLYEKLKRIAGDEWSEKARDILAEATRWE
jgi:hypothetical protein